MGAWLSGRCRHRDKYERDSWPRAATAVLFLGGSKFPHFRRGRIASEACTSPLFAKGKTSTFGIHDTRASQHRVCIGFRPLPSIPSRLSCKSLPRVSTAGNEGGANPDSVRGPDVERIQGFCERASDNCRFMCALGAGTETSGPPQITQPCCASPLVAWI
jgi:hypothetical protein